MLGDPALPHLFFVEGGALAVENALKVAFDWKSRQNERAGRPEPGGHGPSPPPRLSRTERLHAQPHQHRPGQDLAVPQVRLAADLRARRLQFPLADHVEENRRSEDDALAQAAASFAANPHRIACFVAEPIQAEGGDRHLSARFLGEMHELCKANDALFVLDEVQTGVGSYGISLGLRGLVART